MRNRALLSLFMAINIAVCFLAGCGNSGEVHLTDVVEPDTTAVEPVSVEIPIRTEPKSYADLQGNLRSR